jgi:hypothetical protein
MLRFARGVKDSDQFTNSKPAAVTIVEQRTMVFPGHANKKTLRQLQTTHGDAVDYKGCVQQRLEEGTTAPDIANRALGYIDG